MTRHVSYYLKYKLSEANFIVPFIITETIEWHLKFVYVDVPPAQRSETVKA